MMRRGGLILGGAVIVVGVLLLLDNLGVFPGLSVWMVIWPVLFIGLGLWVLVGALWGPRSLPAEDVTIPLEGAGQARIRLKHGAGRLDLRGGADSTVLLDGSFGGGLNYDARREGDVLTVHLRGPSKGVAWAMPWTWGPRGLMDWSLAVNGEIPLALEGEMGANEARLDLSGLRVTDLRLQTGVGATTVTMPTQAGFTRAEIKTGVASMTIRIPDGVAGHIRVQSGLAEVNLDRVRFPRIGEHTYESPDFATAENKIDLRAEIGLGALEIR
jgi:hypothetical protein